MTIVENLARVQERIERAASESGRSASDVLLVAVAKTFSVDVVKDAIEAGVTDVGENRAQELKDKLAALGDRARWHFVGHLQTNKVRQVVGRTWLVHSVDRFGLAEAIGRRASSLGIVQRILIEVNLEGESSKSGVEPARVAAVGEKIAGVEGIEVAGVMAIPPQSDDAEGARPHFKELGALRDELRGRVPTATELSMGMTRDFEVAIQEGATIVRVGEAIFGPRRARA